MTDQMLFGDVPLYYTALEDSLRSEILYRFDDSTPVDLATVTCTWNSTFDDPASELSWTMADDYTVFELNAPMLDTEDFSKSIEPGSSEEVFYYVSPQGASRSFYVTVDNQNDTDAALPYYDCSFSFMDAIMPSVINGVDLRTYAPNDDAMIRDGDEEGYVELDLTKIVEAIGTKPAFVYTYWLPWNGDHENVYMRDVLLVWNTTDGGYLEVNAGIEDKTLDEEPCELSYILTHYDGNSSFAVTDDAISAYNDTFGDSAA